MKKIVGIKRIAGESKELKGRYGRACLQVVLNRVTGRAWSVYHADMHSYVEYENPDIVTCGYLYEPATMSEVKDVLSGVIC